MLIKGKSCLFFILKSQYEEQRNHLTHFSLRSFGKSLELLETITTNGAWHFKERKRFNLILKDKLKQKPWKWKPCNPTETEEELLIVIIFIFNVQHFKEKKHYLYT